MEEIWKNIKGYNGKYQVSNYGKVKSHYKNGKEKILKPIISKKGYYRVGLSNKGEIKYYTIHRLVMNAFVGECNLTIDHLDTNKGNNRLDNLEYVTQRENCIRAWKNKLCKITIHGEKKVNQYDLQNNYIESYKSLSEASRRTNIPIQQISLICNKGKGKTHGFIFRFDQSCQ